MIPEVQQEYDEDYQFFYKTAMRQDWAAPLTDSTPSEVMARILAGEHPVRVFREYRRYTPELLARKSGVDAALIRRIESGGYKALPRTLERIAKALRVSSDEIA